MAYALLLERFERRSQLLCLLAASGVDADALAALPEPQQELDELLLAEAAVVDVEQADLRAALGVS